MAPQRWYHFLAECKAAIFSWDGCQIEMSPPGGGLLLAAVSNEAPRVGAQQQSQADGRGPALFVVSYMPIPCGGEELEGRTDSITDGRLLQPLLLPSC